METHAPTTTSLCASSTPRLLLLLLPSLLGCNPKARPLPPAPSCQTTPDGHVAVPQPELVLTLKDRYHESWLASPAVADLDGDGQNEIIVPRANRLVVWNQNGSVKWSYDTAGRTWASAVVADFTGDARLEVAIANRGQIILLDAAGNALPGFPVTWLDEMRSLAAGDLDGDGTLDLVASPGRGSPGDVMNAWRPNGSSVAGFPPNQSGTSGCTVDGKCYIAGCYDQNLALGDLDGDGRVDLVAAHDNAYLSIHHSSGVAFDANAIFPARKTPGVRYLLDLAEAEQGYAQDEATALQAHFTNSAPAITDLDGNGTQDVIVLGSVQNAAQDRRLLGVALWALNADASRLPGWETPFYAPEYLAGLWDFDGTNIPGATNEVTVADLDPTLPGPELVFAGFDGRIHAVSAQKAELWSYRYTRADNVLTSGVVVGDLSGDGIPEIVFASYSTDPGRGELFVLDAAGNPLHRLPLSGRGALAVPTLADVDQNGTVEIVVSLKDAVDKVESVRVYTVPGSSRNCLLWPTGRQNLLRTAWVRTAGAP